MEKNPNPNRDPRQSDHISESSVTLFGLKVHKFFVNLVWGRIRIWNPGGKKSRSRTEKKSGSGIDHLGSGRDKSTSGTELITLPIKFTLPLVMYGTYLLKSNIF
jgi:hypothetical protein